MRRWWLKVRIGLMWELRDPYDTWFDIRYEADQTYADGVLDFERMKAQRDEYLVWMRKLYRDFAAMPEMWE